MNPKLLNGIFTFLKSQEGKKMLGYMRALGKDARNGSTTSSDLLQSILQSRMPKSASGNYMYNISPSDMAGLMDIIDNFDSPEKDFDTEFAKNVAEENKRRAQQKAWNNEDATAIRDTIMSVDPRLLAVKVIGNAIATGLDTWANNDELKGNMLASALISGGSRSSEAQKAKYGVSAFEQGVNQEAAKKQYEGQSKANIKRGFSRLIRDTIAPEVARANMAREMMAMQQGKVPASYWMYSNGAQHRAQQGGAI